MTGLAEWLTVQVDADESHIGVELDYGQCDALEGVHLEAARALAEVAFKRAILAAHQAEQPFPDEGPQCSRCTGTGLLGIIHSLRWPCPDIWAMAQIYKDRPGYAEAIR